MIQVGSRRSEACKKKFKENFPRGALSERERVFLDFKVVVAIIATRLI